MGRLSRPSMHLTVTEEKLGSTRGEEDLSGKTRLAVASILQGSLQGRKTGQDHIGSEGEEVVDSENRGTEERQSKGLHHYRQDRRGPNK